MRPDPGYRHHKAKKLAFVRLEGKKNIYLGKYGSPESWEKYYRLLAEWKAKKLAGPEPEGPAFPILSVGGLIDRYTRLRVAVHYVKNGRPTSEQDNIAQALRFVRDLYGSTQASEFGPKALKLVREAMIAHGRCRTLINGDLHRIRGMFGWGVSEEILPPEKWQAMIAVTPLQAGKTKAREPEPIEPIAVEIVEATLPHCSRQVAAMIRLQLLTGMRPGEVIQLRPTDVDRSDPTCWAYTPGEHKTEHHGKGRSIILGPKAQAVLTSWLDREPSSWCFSPAEVIAEREAAGLSSGSPLVARPKPGGRYRPDSYRVAVGRACERAFPHPTIESLHPRKRTPADRDILERWRAERRWHPNQLRHTAATAIRAQFGLEASQVILGHSNANITQVYAERDTAKARSVMTQIG